MQVNERAYTSTNSNSKWFLELNIKCETIKHIQETVRENLYDNKFCNSLQIQPLAWSIKEKNDNLECVKMYNFCCVEDTAKGIKRQGIIPKKLFEKHICDKGLITQNILKMFDTQQ